MSSFFDFEDVVCDSHIQVTGMSEDGSRSSHIPLENVFECLREHMPDIMVACDKDNFMPFVIDGNAVMHPVFKDLKEIPKFQSLPSIRGYSKKRLPRSFYGENHGLQIFIYERALACPIAILENSDKEYSHDGWYFFEEVSLLKYMIPDFISLTSRIRDSELSDLLE